MDASPCQAPRAERRLPTKWNRKQPARACERYTLGVRPADTTSEAERIQGQRYAAMTGAERVEVAWRLSLTVRGIAADGIRARHPDYDESEVRHALHRMLLGDALFQAAWPDAPLLAP